MERIDCEVVVLGGGIAGATTALCLAAAGVHTVCLEVKSHPRFAIGESTVPSTTVAFQALSRQYGIPEFDGLCNYFHMKKLGITTYPKCQFWFGLHEEGKVLDKSREFMFETLSPPQGPDSHMLREDLDLFLANLFPKYGVKYYEGISIANVNMGKEEEDPEITVKYLAQPEDSVVKEITFRSKFVVDATGKASYLARKFDLLEKDPSLKNRTRTIYGHFQCGQDFCLDNVLSGRNMDFRLSRNAGTMHHCFEGGWLWAIPFDNNTVSIGLVLDVDQYPYDESVSKEEEFWYHIKRFPTMYSHLSPLVPTKPLIRTGRMQVKAKSILGPRFIVTPHASGFVDALFSTGMLMTVRFVVRFIPRMQKALKTNNFSKVMWTDMEAAFFKELEFIDLMVSASISSFWDYDLFKQIWRIWLESSIRQVADVQVFNTLEHPIYGAHQKPWLDCLKNCHELVMVAKSDHSQAAPAAAKIKELLDKEITLLCRFPGDFELNKPSTTSVNIFSRTEYEPAILFGKVYHLFWLIVVAFSFIGSYWFSKLRNTPYHKQVDHFYELRNPAHRNKYDFWSFIVWPFLHHTKFDNAPVYDPVFT
eukprot:Phypoly_transcript_04388.p1 GENE.Phypoly_transcript_04388~~Phypoly_transcript_04388.p1  ORF type:complete len:590 (+),score=62.53 Phypoly_transcript_04388:367-2136(+)